MRKSLVYRSIQRWPALHAPAKCRSGRYRCRQVSKGMTLCGAREIAGGHAPTRHSPAAAGPHLGAQAGHGSSRCSGGGISASGRSRRRLPRKPPEFPALHVERVRRRALRSSAERQKQGDKAKATLSRPGLRTAKNGTRPTQGRTGDGAPTDRPSCGDEGAVQDLARAAY